MVMTCSEGWRNRRQKSEILTSRNQPTDYELTRCLTWQQLWRNRVSVLTRYSNGNNSHEIYPTRGVERFSVVTPTNLINDDIQNFPETTAFTFVSFQYWMEKTAMQPTAAIEGDGSVQKEVRTITCLPVLQSTLVSLPTSRSLIYTWLRLQCGNKFLNGQLNI